MTYTIKTISQPEKVWTLHRNMLMPVNHILQTVDDVMNVSFITGMSKVININKPSHPRIKKII